MGNVGIATASPVANLDNQGSAGTYRQRGVTTMVTNTLGASGTQSKRYEIARLTIDYNDWNYVGVLEVELYERYYNAGLKKKYSIYYGYVSNSGCNLIEMSGYGTNAFQVTIGAEVVISGDIRYIPVYVDINYYSFVTAILKTNRELTTSNPPGAGGIWLNNNPTGTDIASFTPDSLVYVGNIIGGNSTFSSGNLLVGTTTDAGYKLDVNGTGIVRGTFSVESINQVSRIVSTNTTLYNTYRANSIDVGYIGNGEGLVASGSATDFGIRAENNLILAIGNSTKLYIAYSGAATFASTLTAAGNYLIANASASKKGYTFSSPASNWGAQTSGIYFNPIDGVNATPTFTINLWNGTFGTAGYGGFTDVLTINGAGGAATFSSSVTATSFNGNATTATNISNTGTVTLATATEANSIYITQPSYTTDTPVKLLNFAWYSDVWQMGNIRSGGVASNGFGIYLSGSEKIRIATSGNLLIGTTTDAGYKLDVTGSARFNGSGSNGYLYVFGNAGAGGSTNPAYLQGMNFSWNKSNGGGESLITYTNQGGGSNIRFGIGYWNNSTYSEQFSIASTGVATFASSVTATEFIGIDNATLKADNFNTNATVLTLNSRGTVGTIKLQTNSIDRFSIASAGAATFSSSVTATNGYISATYNAGDVITWGGIAPYANLYGALSWDIDKAIVKGRSGFSLGLYVDDNVNKGITIATTGAATFSSSVTAGSFIKSGGTSAQFLKADGSIDSNTYATTSALAAYLSLSGGTITGDLTVNNKVYVGTHGCYFEEVLIGSTYELRVVDSAGNMTVLS